ncbi:class I SAM-dependent methyltransferase [Candidatus Parcubacteria bacterium]|nr:class I SAM-dependent methyltransferase [Candidatus Parcubacteria bacterium]
MKKQVNRLAYNFQKYCAIEKWCSYWHQINEIIKCKPTSVLEVGVGDGTVDRYLTDNTDIKYASLDIADDLKPDIVGSVDEMPLPDNAFDLVCAFEVLEHLPFEKFEKSLKEMQRVSQKYVLISLPHWGRHFAFSLRLPYFRKIRWQHKFNLSPMKHKFDRQHYWEIGKRDFPLLKIKKSIKNSGYTILRDYICFESPYHHFFVLEKKN